MRAIFYLKNRYVNMLVLSKINRHWKPLEDQGKIGKIIPILYGI
jgi:hypothetical protein